MKKITALAAFAAVIIIFAGINVRAEYNLGKFKVGQTLTDPEGVLFFKEYRSRPEQPWPEIKLTEKDIPKGPRGEMIRYAVDILTNTESIIGPYGKLKWGEPEINCVACHMADENGLPGTKEYALPFLNLLNDYPKLDIETMKIITVTDRVRQMVHGGPKWTDDTKEMKAVMEYFKWLKESYKIKNGVRIDGTFLIKMDFPDRPANPVSGEKIYKENCAMCHGPEGRGKKNPGYEKGAGHIYPSLLAWPDGGHMSMIPFLARFIYPTMPPGATASDPILTPGEAIDAAAYINTGFARNPIQGSENRAGIEAAYSKAPSLKPEYFAVPQQILDPKEYIKIKYGPWKNPNFFPGE